MTGTIDLELLQASVCLAAGQPVSVMVRVANQGDVAADVVLDIEGQLAERAELEPAELRLEPSESRVARITFQPDTEESLPSGPVPYALRARAGGEQLAVAFGLVDVHRQRSQRPSGTGIPHARPA